LDLIIADSIIGKSLVAFGAFFAGAGSLLSGFAALRACKKDKEVKEKK
jgi:hypothetical protein